jgi:hypothetical protein
MKEESVPPSSMLFRSVCDMEKEKVEEDLQMTMTQMTDLPMMSLMEQASRTTSPSHQSTISKLWDPSLKSSIETEPELTYSLLNS